MPIWVYTAVHVTGVAKILPEAKNLEHSDQLSAYFEEKLLSKKPWLSSKMEDHKRAAMIKAIVTLSIQVKTIEGQKKLIQHKGEAEHRSAIAGLKGRHQPSSEAIAKLIEEVATTKFG